ncbi:hypothetical protein LOZ51_003059 [Ophidiomyces ophidiicola]|nr:hypothetical protein LOZ55_006735 [Ophidiomyces ophidiicola]KAI1978948.1 hypothetical protein LOZ54_006190 [Ophidiomyces ophidiicola]KAI1996897.1 hypothetical protein LOZ51_003059 [Ophidiomyces ophidiicola]
MATPFSKNNLGATPTQYTSSPHPSAVPMGRPLSHKSPSMKTPSASGHGHQNHPSAPSYSIPTPLPMTAAGLEDPAMFSSPSALIALGLSGITPSPAAQDVLGVQGMADSDVHALPIPPLGIAKDIDEERRKRIDEVVALLRTRVAGRGVCRESVERLGRLEGLECMWQDNDLSIAGNSVDLEIEFQPGQEIVTNVTLRYATPDAPEGERRAEASEVLRRNLEQTPGDQQSGRWKPLGEFHENLRRLAIMDQLSREVNCFEATEGVYESLKRVWIEEKNRGMHRGDWEHLCKGWVGRPSLHGGKHLGLVLDYWAEQNRMLDSEERTSENKMDTDKPPNGDKNSHPNLKLWSAAVECEIGYPPVRISKDWVAEVAFTEIDTQDGNDTAKINMVNWVEPPTTLVSTLSSNPQSALDPPMLSGTTPNVRFAARLEPPVAMPTLVASEVYRVLGLNMAQELKITTYDLLVVPPHIDRLDFLDIEAKQSLHEREVYRIDEHGKAIGRPHLYTFSAVEQVPGRTISELPFAHPRQISEILPVLRQYALLSNLLRRVFNDSTADPRTNRSISPEKPEPHVFTESTPDGYYISNINPTERQLDSMLLKTRRGGFRSSPSDTQTLRPLPAETGLRADISLRTPIGGVPSIIVVFSVDETLLNNEPTLPYAVSEMTPQTVMMNVEIRLNGTISISEVSGLWQDEHDDDKTEAERKTFCAKASKVLETCEDVGLLIEWVVRWMRKQNKK